MPEQKERRTWTVEEIKELLKTNDKFVCRALLKLYEFQTEDEKRCKDTTERNNVGFNSYDAEFLSSVAEGLKKYGRLTEKQLFYTRKKIMKYSKQIALIANS